jgi:hypothetical protein
VGIVALWGGEVALPPIVGIRTRVGRNSIRQVIFRGATTKADIFVDQLSGHFLSKTKLRQLFENLLIRESGGKRRAADLPIVTAAGIEDPAQAPALLHVKWDNAAMLTSRADTPDKVLTRGSMNFNFAKKAMVTISRVFARRRLAPCMPSQLTFP